MKIVTGYGGEPHVTAEQDGSMLSGIVGKDEYVLQIGKQFKAEAVTANKVNVYDGSLMMQGRHCVIEADDYNEFTIANGTQGQKRNDILVATYTKNTTTGVETVTCETVKGTPGSTAKDPTITSGDIRAGASKNQMPLYRVSLNGLNIESITQLFATVPSISDLNARSGTEYYASGLRIVKGTKIVTPAASHNRHTLFENFKATYGGGASIVVTNGDFDACPIAITGTTYCANSDLVYCHLDSATSTKFRVDYTIIYSE